MFSRLRSRRRGALAGPLESVQQAVIHSAVFIRECHRAVLGQCEPCGKCPRRCGRSISGSTTNPPNSASVVGSGRTIVGQLGRWIPIPAQRPGRITVRTGIIQHVVITLAIIAHFGRPRTPANCSSDRWDSPSQSRDSTHPLRDIRHHTRDMTPRRYCPRYNPPPARPSVGATNSRGWQRRWGCPADRCCCIPQSENLRRGCPLLSAFGVVSVESHASHPAGLMTSAIFSVDEDGAGIAAGLCPIPRGGRDTSSWRPVGWRCRHYTDR